MTSNYELNDDSFHFRPRTLSENQELPLNHTSIKHSDFMPTDHLRSAWNTLKFGWNVWLWPAFDRNCAIYLLGRCYLNQNTLEKSLVITGSLTDFARDFSSKLWFTYRQAFPSLLCNCFNHESSNSSSPVNSQKPLKSYGKSYNMKNEANANRSINDIYESHGIFTTSCSVLAKPHSSFTQDVHNRSDSFVPKMKKLFRRSSKQQIPLSIQTSDCGWGCMFRCGQMLLAQSLVVHFLGRDWRLPRRKPSRSFCETEFHRQIIKWFNDSWDRTSPLSLHRLVRASGQKPGEWCGPATICNALLKTMVEAAVLDNRLGQLKIYLARDRVIYREEIMNLSKGTYCQDQNHMNFPFTDHSANYDLCSEQIQNQHVKNLTTQHSAIILLIPLMFGPDKYIQPCYSPLIFKLFSDPTFVGLIGGRPKHSCYFIGCQNDLLIYLDPHVSQSAIDMKTDDFPVDSWFCQVPKVMRISKLDPCCAVGFYCRTRSELSDLLDRLPDLMSIPEHIPKNNYVVEVVHSPKVNG